MASITPTPDYSPSSCSGKGTPPGYELATPIGSPDGKVDLDPKEEDHMVQVSFISWINKILEECPVPPAGFEQLHREWRTKLAKVSPLWLRVGGKDLEAFADWLAEWDSIAKSLERPVAWLADNHNQGDWKATYYVSEVERLMEWREWCLEEGIKQFWTGRIWAVDYKNWHQVVLA